MPSVAQIEDRIERLATETLRSSGALGVGLFVAYGAIHAFEFPSGLRLPILIHDALVIAMSAGVAVLTRGRTVVPHASFYLAALAFAFMSNTLVATYLRGDSWYDYYAMLLFIGAGAVFVRRPALLLFLGTALGSWTVLALSIPLEPPFARRIALMLGAIAAAVLINHLRVHWLRQIESLRAREEAQREELALALNAARDELHERQKTEVALKASETQFRALFERLVDGIAVLEWDGSDFLIRTINRIVPAVDPERLKGRRLSEALPAIRNTPIWKHLHICAENGTETRETSVHQEFREKEYVLDYLVFRLPGGEVVLLFKNRTEEFAAAKERDSMQKKLLQTQKLEGLGVLAGGVAHDFNNLLMGILANADAAATRTDDSRFLGECLGDIKLAAENAAGLCRQLLAYAGQGQVVADWIDPTAVITSLDALIESAAGNSRLIVELDSAPGRILTDGDQLGQVVLNLISNAADAGSTVITLRSETRELSGRDLRAAVVGANLVAGCFHVVSVRDDGEGVAPEHLPRIFDPFFSTRFTGRGLGLSAVAGIVSAHGGAVFVDSTTGQGANFIAAFPVEPAVAGATTPAAVNLAPQRPHVLLVDDDLTARRSVRRLLELDDVEITEASDGDEALEVADASGDVFDLVLLDLTMPRRGGIDTFPELAETLPRARIVIMSGYDADADAVGALTQHPRFGGFLAKPYTLSSLRQVVNGTPGE